MKKKSIPKKEAFRPAPWMGFILAGSICLCTAALGGCGGGSGSIENNESQGSTFGGEQKADIPSWQQYAEEEITFDWYVNFSWYTTPWGENLVSRTITEETGVNVRFIAPTGNGKEKLNALMASDTLPDIITLGWWENQINEMIDGDMVYALNELADSYDAYFWEVCNDKVIQWNTKEDGNVYYYTNSFYLPEDYEVKDNIGSNQTFLVRKDIYEAIGSPDMSTKEGFREAVRKAVEMFPEVDQEPLIPIGAHEFTDTGCDSFDQYLQNFLAVPFEKNGEYYDRFTDPDYIDWLKFFRELGQEGYLSRDIFIDQRTQMEEKLVKGRYFCMLYQRTDILSQQKERYSKDPNSIYIAIDGPKNSAGEDHVLPGAGINGWTVTLISKNCSRPDRAIAFFSYLMSEHGQKMTFLGVEGVTYDMVDQKAVLYPEVQTLLDTDRKEFDRIYGADNAYWMFQNNVMQLNWAQKLREPSGQLEEWTYPYTHYLGQYEINYETNRSAGYYGTNIEKLWSQTLPSLLLADSEEEFDRLLQEFVRQREELGFALVKEESVRQVTEAKQKLGIRD